MRRCIASPLSPCNLARSGSAFASSLGSLSPSPVSSPLYGGKQQVAHSSTKSSATNGSTPKKKSSKKANSSSTTTPGKRTAQLKIDTPTPTFSESRRQDLGGLLDDLLSPSVAIHPSSQHMPSSPVAPAVQEEGDLLSTPVPKQQVVPRRQVSASPKKKNITSTIAAKKDGKKNQTSQILDDFVTNLNVAVPKSDVATRLRIALFEEREFLFIAEPSVVTSTGAEEGAAASTSPAEEPEQQTNSTPTRSSHTVEEVGDGMVRVSLNKIIAEELNLNLPPQLLLEGNETPEEAEFLLEAKEREIMIKSHLTKELKAQGFTVEEVIDSLDTLDARMEAQLMENLRNKTQGLGDSNFQPGETKSMEEFAAEAMHDFTQAKASMVEAQQQQQQQQEEGQGMMMEQHQQPQQQAAPSHQEDPEVPSELEAEVERLQNDYNKIFEAQRPRLFMNFLQRGSYEKESNSTARRTPGSNFIDELEAQQREEAAELAASQQRSTSITVTKTTKQKKPSTTHAHNLVGAETEAVGDQQEQEEEVTQHFEIQTEVDTDLLGLNEQKMKFFVNDGKSVALVADGAGSSASTPSSFSEDERDQILARAVKKSVEAGVSLVALGVRLQNKRPATQVKNSIEDRLISSHAYVLEGSKVGQMKKRANDLYHPLLLATCSQPSSAPPANAAE